VSASTGISHTKKGKKARDGSEADTQGTLKALHGDCRAGFGQFTDLN
jgi:hypothetical protein